MNNFKSLTEILYSIASKENKGITFINSGNAENNITYHELLLKAKGILFYMQSKGIKAGNELVFQIPDKENESFVLIFWACLLGGIIPVPVSVGNNDEHRLKLMKIWNILNDPYLVTESKILSQLEKYAVENDFTKEYRDIAHRTLFVENISCSDGCGSIFEPKADDLAFIQFSSGSTGDPKGVELTHENLITNINDINSRLDVKENCSTLSWMPLTHDMGMICFHLASLAAGINQYIIPTSLFIQHPTLWLSKASEHNVTGLYSPNFGYQYFLKFFKHEIAKGWDLSCVRFILNGAEPISVQLINEFADKLSSYGLNRKVLLPSYGLAEASVGVACKRLGDELFEIHVERKDLAVGKKIKISENKNDALSLVGVGQPIDNCKIRICDDQNNILPDMYVGNIQIMGGNVTKGYFNNEMATKKLFTQDKWLITGDLGFLINGNLIVTGRAKDIIFISGQNYYPHDVERVLEEVTGLELGKVVCCGVYNERLRGDEIIAFVVHKGKLKDFIKISNDAKKHVNSKMGLVLNNVIPIMKIPKTTSGKIQRYKLGNQYINGEYNGIINEVLLLSTAESSENSTVTGRNTIESYLTELWRGLLKKDEIDINDNFFEIGGTSILLTQMQGILEDKYPGIVNKTDIFTYHTIKELTEYIESKYQKSNYEYNFDGTIFPEEFIKEDFHKERASTFKFEISDKLYNDVMELSHGRNMKIENVLLSIFIYLLAEITEQEIISIQLIMDDFDSVISSQFNLNNVNDFNGLLDLVNGANSDKGLSLNNSLTSLRSSKKRKESRCIIPVFCKQELLPSNVKMTELFDLIMCIESKPTSIHLSVEYNENILKKQKVKELVNSYLKLMRILIGDEIKEKQKLG